MECYLMSMNPIEVDKGGCKQWLELIQQFSKKFTCNFLVHHCFFQLIQMCIAEIPLKVSVLVYHNLLRAVSCCTQYVS